MIIKIDLVDKKTESYILTEEQERKIWHKITSALLDLEYDYDVKARVERVE
jgi:hypothetical protein